MSARPVPFGSLWRVEKFVAESIKKLYQGLRQPVPDTEFATVTAMSHPRQIYRRDADSMNMHIVKFEVGDILLIGEQVIDWNLGATHEWTQVLLPIPSWINRTHFNEGVGYLRRIA